ncbi:MAG: hypothetical protein GY861_22660 [bacterium]|nr:hypothetical protein [bacterium]
MATLSVNDFKVLTRRIAGMVVNTKTALSSRSVESTMVSSVDDLTVESFDYLATTPRAYVVMISAEGTPDGFRWSNDGGVTWATEASVSDSAVTLELGVQVSWGATTGHKVGDRWLFRVNNSYSAYRMLEAVATMNDIDPQRALLNPVYDLAERLDSPGNVLSQLYDIIRVIDVHLGGLSSWLESSDTYVNSEIQDIYGGIEPGRVIPPVTDLGRFEFSGAGAGTFTAGTAVDSALYGGANLEVFALTAVGDGSVTVEGVNFAGDPVTLSSQAFGGALTQYDTVTIAGSERIISLTNVTVTGGAASQVISVRVKRDWDPIL